MFGTETIWGTGLRATESGDLQIIARLMSQLPLFGLVESDGSDLIGGSIPMPFRSGRWVLDGQSVSSQKEVVNLPPIANFGEIPDVHILKLISQQAANAGGLHGQCGMWVYTTQRVLSLAWAARAVEVHGHVRVVLGLDRLNTVACTWADSRSMAEDGCGWTRYVPSTVKTLLIVTQVDLPQVCRLYERVVDTHLAAGVTVLTFTPDTGTLKVQYPTGSAVSDAIEKNRIAADILVVPRARRTTAYPKYLTLPKDIDRKDVEVMAALRLDPADQQWLGAKIPEYELLTLSERQVMTEAKARTLTSSWEAFTTGLIKGETWRGAEDLAQQLSIVECLIKKVEPLTDNPLLRRALIYAAMKGEAEGPLSPKLPIKLDAVLTELLAEAEETPDPKANISKNYKRKAKRKRWWQFWQ